MARQPMVTRTLKTTKVTALCLNFADNTTCEKEFTLPRTFPNEKQLMKALAQYNNDDYKIIHVLRTEIAIRYYGMTELEFIEHARILNNKEDK